MNFVTAKYRFPKSVDAEKQAKVIAIGQTAGTWDARWDSASEAFHAHMGKVGNVAENPDGSKIAAIQFPIINFENDIGSLLTILFGKYSMAGPAKLVGIELPENYGSTPKFGAKGVRKLLGVYDRPLIMAIFKPALGLSAKQHAEILSEVAFAGIDIIKDDEILGDISSAPTFERLRECKRVIDDVKLQTGKTVLYAINVTGRADKLIENARKLVKEGANALLLNVLSYGYSVLEALANDAEINVPIFAHPAFAGALCLGEDTGVSYPVTLGTLMTRAGADAVLYPAHYGNLPFSRDIEMEIRDTLMARGVLPVPSAGIHPGVVPMALADYGNNVVLNAGTGIMDHPDGPAAGVKAFYEAIEIAKPGSRFDLSQIADGNLKKALEKWGC